MMVCLFMFVSYLSLPYIIYKRRFRGNIAFVAFISCCNLLRESVRAAKLQNGTKQPSARTGNLMPRANVSTQVESFCHFLDCYLSPNVMSRRILLTVLGWTFKNEAMSCKSRNSMIPGQRCSNISQRSRGVVQWRGRQRERNWLRMCSPIMALSFIVSMF